MPTRNTTFIIENPSKENLPNILDKINEVRLTQEFLEDCLKTSERLTKRK